MRTNPCPAPFCMFASAVFSSALAPAPHRQFRRQASHRVRGYPHQARKHPRGERGQACQAAGGRREGALLFIWSVDSSRSGFFWTLVLCCAVSRLSFWLFLGTRVAVPCCAVLCRAVLCCTPHAHPASRRNSTCSKMSISRAGMCSSQPTP